MGSTVQQAFKWTSEDLDDAKYAVLRHFMCFSFLGEGCSAVNPQKCFVQYETQPDFLLA